MPPLGLNNLVSILIKNPKVNVTVIVAIITSVTSLIVALISLINANRSAKRLELLKFEYDRRRANFALSNEYFKSNIESLGLFIKAIQRVKDVLFLCVNSIETSLDSEAAIKLISEAREHVFQVYEEESSSLENIARAEVHKIKTTTYNTEFMLKEYLEDKDFAAELSVDQKKSLISIRENLSDCQNLLRDIRTQNLNQRLDKYE